MNLKCPIYNMTGACDLNRNCVFLRQGGCAVVLGATISEKNQKKLENLEQRLAAMEHNIRIIADALNRR